MVSHLLLVASTVLTILSTIDAKALVIRTGPPKQPSCVEFTPFVYAGCYKDDSSPRTLLYSSNLDSKTMTVEKCVAFCKGNDYKYAGLEYYGECYCGASVNALQIDEKNCNFPCNGNKTESCGGGKIISIYQDPTFPVVSTKTISDYMSMGCYSEGPNGRTLGWKQDGVDPATLTVPKCLASCLSGGYAFAGVEFGKECYCGVVLGNGTMPLNPSECNFRCTGDSTQFCGGRSKLNLYVAKNLESVEPCEEDGPMTSSSSTLPTSTSSSLTTSLSSTSTSFSTTSLATTTQSPTLTTSSQTSTSSSTSSEPLSSSSSSTESSSSSTTEASSLTSSESLSSISSSTESSIASTTEASSSSSTESSSSSTTEAPSSTSSESTSSSPLSTESSSITSSTTSADTSSTTSSSESSSSSGVLPDPITTPSTTTTSSTTDISSTSTSSSLESISTTSELESSSGVLPTPITTRSSEQPSSSTTSTFSTDSSASSSTTETSSTEVSSSGTTSSTPEPSSTLPESQSSSTVPLSSEVTSSSTTSISSVLVVTSSYFSSSSTLSIATSTPLVTYPPTTTSSTTTITISICTSYYTVYPPLPSPTCAYKLGNWCAKPISEFSDTFTCLKSYASCVTQLSACFSKAGFPELLKCNQFNEFCSQIANFCDNFCPGKKCTLSNCKQAIPPYGVPAVPTQAPVAIYSSLYTCPPSATPTPTLVLPTQFTTATSKSISTPPIPTYTNICTQPNNPSKGYSTYSPVGGIPLPNLSCNNDYFDYTTGHPFKLYTSSDTYACPSYEQSGSYGPSQGCRDACDEQYKLCNTGYAEPYKSYKKSKRGGNDTYSSACQKCENQRSDCYLVNKAISGGQKCGTFNKGY